MAHEPTYSQFVALIGDAWAAVEKAMREGLAIGAPGTLASCSRLAQMADALLEERCAVFELPWESA